MALGVAFGSRNIHVGLDVSLRQTGPSVITLTRSPTWQFALVYKQGNFGETLPAQYRGPAKFFLHAGVTSHEIQRAGTIIDCAMATPEHIL
jgi:hypothetical protein